MMILKMSMHRLIIKIVCLIVIINLRIISPKIIKKGYLKKILKTKTLLPGENLIQKTSLVILSHSLIKKMLFQNKKIIILLFIQKLHLEQMLLQLLLNYRMHLIRLETSKIKNSKLILLTQKIMYNYHKKCIKMNIKTIVGRIVKLFDHQGLNNYRIQRL